MKQRTFNIDYKRSEREGTKTRPVVGSRLEMIGRTLGHYRIESKIGAGGMGVVYRAFDTHLDRWVAIKVLRPDLTISPERKRRFVQEAKAASALNHPNIIHVYDINRFFSKTSLIPPSPSF